MALEAQGRDRGDEPPAEAGKDPVQVGAPALQQRPTGGRHVMELPQKREDQCSVQHREPGSGPRRGLLRRHPFAFLAGLLLLLVGAAGGYLYWDYAGHFEATDDAFIAARQFANAPKVSGYITAVPVTDNEHVAAGAVIARIDDRDYRVALEQARAQVATAEAGIKNIEAQITVQEAQIAANRAQVDQAQAALVFAHQQAARYQDLAQKGAGSVQNAQQFASQLHQQEAALESAQASLKLAQRQVQSLSAQRESAEANLAQG